MSADPIVYCLENLTDYRQFERLCTDVMHRSGYSEIVPIGGTNDGGRDALHVSRDNPTVETIFAYSVRGDWKNKLINEDCERIREVGHSPQRIVFVCTSAISATARDAAEIQVRDDFGWQLELVDIELLRVKLAGEL